MPRKSIAALALAPVLTLRRRPDPWPGLTERETQLWRDIVAAQAVDWFSPGDQPILAAYCRAIALHEEASTQARGQPLTITTDKGAQQVNPILQVQDMAAKQMANLAAKLRLSQSAKWTEQKAATKHANADPKKPWQ